jgi:tripartite-type tricarboxylate transporter receptor subunit TctC
VIARARGQERLEEVDAMKKFGQALLFAMVGVISAVTWAHGDAWPSKPIRLIVPLAPGGGTDFHGRFIAQHLSQRLGQQVYVENRDGANGMIGLRALKQAEPDGYTIAVSSDTPFTVNPYLYKEVPYDSRKDFTPIALMTEFPLILVAHPSVKARTIPELIAFAKANPNALAYGLPGHGNVGQLGMELFIIATGTKFVHVPFKGGGPAMQALLAGNTQLQVNNVAQSIPHMQTGAFVPLGVTTPKRLAALPDVPAIGESVPGYEITGWIGLFGPAGMPAPIVERLARETAAILRDPTIVAQLEKQHIAPKGTDGKALAEVMRRDMEKWSRVISTAGIKVE